MESYAVFFITIISIDMNKQAKLKQDQDVAKDDLTIILSYPHVYRFKPICYGMIVAVLNCHSSVITIMEKNDNILCINYTIKTGTVREQVQNLLKRLLFFIKTGFSFVKNSLQSRLRPGCTHHGDPGAGEVQTRVCVRSLRGCVDVYPPCWRYFYALFWHLFCRWLFFWL